MAKTIRGELKKLVAKLGGTPSKDDLTAELIHKVTDNVSGGPQIFVVNYLWNEEAGDYVCDKTHDEIVDARFDGRLVVMRTDNGYVFPGPIFENSVSPICFNQLYYEVIGEHFDMMVDIYRVFPDNTVDMIRKSWEVSN